MKKLQKQAFTLVELIVVITILAILGTIAFISFQNYSRNARDGVRIADINNIEKCLGIFITEKGFYPIPDYGTPILWSGALARTQGTAGDNVTTNLRNLSKKPVDPLTANEYTYSVANNNVEYQVATILEGGSMVFNLPVTNRANAATTKIATSKVKGTYNEKILKVNTGGLDYILAVPSIINSNINHVDLQDIITNKELVFNNYENLPDSYKNSGYTMTGGFEFVPGGDIVVYSGSICMSGDTEKLRFINNLKTIYNGTLLQGDSLYSEIINVDTINNPTGAIALVDNYIRNHIGGIVCQNLPLSEIPPTPVACSLTQNQVDTLNGYVTTGDLEAWNSEGGTVTPSNEDDWCNIVKSIDWYGGSSIPSGIWNLTNLTELFLGGNLLTTLPAEIGNLTNLTYLSLYDNSLTTLPSEIGNLTNLTELILGANSFATLPSEIGNLTNLTYLSLPNNSLTTLSPEIGNLTNLTELDLTDNSLTTLPLSFGNLINITDLGLYNNSLTTLPPSFGNLTKLTELLLTNNSLATLPTEIGNLTNLTVLDLDNNLLTTLPAGIGNLTNLTRLWLENNQLTSLPAEFSSLTNLEWLKLNNNINLGIFSINYSPSSACDSRDNFPTAGKTMSICGGEVAINITVSEMLVGCTLNETQVETLSGLLSTGDLYAYDIDRNELSSLTESDWCNTVKSIDWVGLSDIPVEIGNLTNLNELHLSRNELTSLPLEIGNLTNLTVLDLYHNSLTTLPSEISNLNNLTYLRLSENSLADLPPEILNLTNLTDLDLDTNSLTTLPSEIGNLTNLTNLILAHNSLVSLPSEIGNLTNLTVLDLNNNSFVSLPSEIGNLTNLTILDLLSNSLTSIPSSIGSLTNLTQLNLGFNSLSSIPPEIGSLINLTSLNLRNNSLTSIPPEIGSLINLNELYLMYNSLASLPVEIGNLTNLTRVYFDNNSLSSIPSSIGSLTNLTVLDLLHNSLSTLPSEIGSIANLNELYLSNNNLLGTLSTDFFNYVPKSKSQYGIPTTGKTMTISPNGTKIVITVTVTPQ